MDKTQLMQTLKKSGFTIVEFVFVLIIISILASAAYVRWPGFVVNLDGQVQQVASDIRYAQSLSMTKGERYRFVRASATSYQITNSTGTPILLARGTSLVTLTNGITFGTWSNLPNNLIVFGGDGTPYVDTGSPGTALSGTATIPLVAGTQTESITITPTTGRVITS